MNPGRPWPILTGVRFHSVVELGGKTATGIRVPDEVVEGLGGGRRPAVTVTIGTYSYRSTVAPMGGVFLVPLSAEHRTAAGLAAGDGVEVDLELDVAPREVSVPEELAQALATDPTVQQFYDSLSFTHRKEWARWVGEAKRGETRTERAGTALGALRAGKRQR